MVCGIEKLKVAINCEHHLAEHSVDRGMAPTEMSTINKNIECERWQPEPKGENFSMPLKLAKL